MYMYRLTFLNTPPPLPTNPYKAEETILGADTGPETVHVLVSWNKNLVSPEVLVRGL